MTDARPSEPSGAWLVRRYPRWWRDRYADEVLALLEDRPGGWRDRVDLAHGAIDAHLRGDGGRSHALLVSALVAGGAWTLTGVAALAQPVPLDWPGYAIDTLPIVVVGALAMTAAQLGLARRAWPATTIALEALLVIVALAGLTWSLALAMAMAGGPYGAITAAVQAVAAVVAVALGLVVLRVGATVEGLVVIVTAAALLIPTPAVWLGLGAGWTAVGIAAALGPEPASPSLGAA